MNADFLTIKHTEGELKLSHKKKNYGMTITTQEFIFHKPNINYYVKYKDLVSIVKYESHNLDKTNLFLQSTYYEDRLITDTKSTLYKLMISHAIIHNRSGVFTIGLFDMIIPIHQRLLSGIIEYSGLQGVEVYVGEN